MVVEDDLSQLQVICHLFEVSHLPLRVLRTRSPMVALDIAQTERPDVIVSDWHMPELTGIELIEELKKHELTRDIPVLMCTGVHLKDTDLCTSLSSGAVDYLRKPINQPELIARVANMIRLSKQHETIKSKNALLEEEIRQHRITLDKLKLSQQFLEKSLAENERLARLDMLTELPNRRACIENFDKMLSLATRKGMTIGLAIADLDHFKSINDNYGHDCGDRVLVEAAKVFRQAIRESDFVGRWGGEEFVFYFMDVGAEAFAVVSEKIRKSIDKHTVVFGCNTLSFSVSIGGCIVTEDLDQAVKMADEALYVSKSRGRNRVEFITQPDNDKKLLTEPC